MKKKIYLVHEYGIESHFKALYDCADLYGYDVSAQIILSKIEILKRLKASFNKKIIWKGIKNFCVEILNHYKIYFIKNSLMVVGIAPYDYLLNKYSGVFRRNMAFYFTSQTDWSGNVCIRGDKNNIDQFVYLLKQDFKGAFCVTNKAQLAINNIFDRSAVVYHAIDYKKYIKKGSYLTSKNKKYIFIGAYNDNKNIQAIIEWINKTNYELQFDFAGTGPLEYLIDELQKKDHRVSNLGYCTKNQIQNFLHEYDFLVLPSKEERFGIVLVEAMAAGVPCIVSNTDGPMEVVENQKNGLIFNVNKNNEEFFQTMDYSYNIDTHIYSEMSKYCIEFSKKFDSQEIVKKWINLIEEV